MTALADIMHALAQGGGQPLYQRLQRALRTAIDQRVFAPEQALPAERQLAADLSISRITVRKAIDGLVDEGLLVRRPGSGNFINTRIEKNFATSGIRPPASRVRSTISTRAQLLQCLAHAESGTTVQLL